jgi:hypothetical protein
MRTRLRSVLATGFATVVVSTTLALGAPTVASAAYCGQVWGSLSKWVATTSDADVVNVRTGQHACFDRLVVDLHGPVAGYNVGYVSQVTEEGSGFVVPLRGGARLGIGVTAPAYNEDAAATYSPANPRELRRVAGYRTFRQVAWAGTFEGYSAIGLGVRARLPFRVFILPGPGAGSRLVIDVGHRW